MRRISTLLAGTARRALLPGAWAPTEWVNSRPGPAAALVLTVHRQIACTA